MSQLSQNNTDALVAVYWFNHWKCVKVFKAVPVFASSFLQDTPAGALGHPFLCYKATPGPTIHSTLSAGELPFCYVCFLFAFFVCFELCSNSTVDCLLCVALTLFSFCSVLFCFVKHFCTVCCRLTLQHHFHPSPSHPIPSLIFPQFCAFFWAVNLC